MMLKRLKRLTADNANGCTERMLNNIYAKDGRVVIRFTEDDRKDVDLCKYIAEKCKCNYSADDIMKLGCGDCQMCPYGTMYAACVQAAELRERLKMYEDKEEQGLLLELPCKVGDMVYEPTNRKTISIYEISAVVIKNDVVFTWELLEGYYSNVVGFEPYQIGKTVFLTREEAEAKLKELNKNAE